MQEIANNAQPDPELWSIKTVAQKLDAGESSIFQWVREGTFPEPVKRGPKFTRWRSEDVHAWMRSLESS